MMFDAFHSTMVFPCGPFSAPRNPKNRDGCLHQSEAGTQARCPLESGPYQDPLQYFWSESFLRVFQSLSCCMVSGVDVSISVDMDGVQAQVHNGFPPALDRRSQWIRSLSYVPAGVNAPADKLADSVSSRLTEIREGETCYGLAALRIDYTAPQDFLTAKAVGGFVTHDSQGAFVGLIDHLPNSAKREPGKIAAPKQAMDSWLFEQVSLLPRNFSRTQNILACYSLCHFEYDPIDVLIGIPVITSDARCLLAPRGPLRVASRWQ